MGGGEFPIAPVQGWECPRCGIIWSPLTPSCTCIKRTGFTYQETTNTEAVWPTCGSCGRLATNGHTCTTC